MKIDNVDIVSAQGVVANLSFRDPGANNPYLVKHIYGIDADNIQKGLVPTEASGESFNLYLPNREIVIRAALNPDFVSADYADLRNDMYRAIYSDRTGKLRLNFKEGSTFKAYIEGYVTKFESPYTQREPEFQITMDCPDSMLQGDLVGYGLSGATPNPVTFTDDLSTAPHGVEMIFNFTGSVLDFKIGNSSAFDWFFSVDARLMPSGYGFASGDSLHISSIYNNKEIYVLKFGDPVTKYPISSNVEAFSEWPIMFPGINSYFVQANTSAWQWANFNFRHTYWGV